MKATFKYIVTAFAVCAALVSCQKDNLAGNTDDNPAVGNARVIEVHFGAATKSALAVEAGLTPSFVNGDKIMASNGTSKEECSISVDNNGDASFTTSLTGDLTAVYPSAAAKLNGNAIEGVIVPATQDGTFAKANIAKATIASSATSATFVNQTSLLRFYVDESIGVKSITITADGNANIADGSKTIVVDPEGDTTLDTVTDDPGGRICYVSVLPGTFTSLKFTSVTTTQTDYTNNTVERTANSVTLATNKIYNAFIPYYIDLGTAGKWGYCNIGAFLPEDAGMYFAWGETSGHYPDTEGMVYDDDGEGWEGAFEFVDVEDGFFLPNCPYFSEIQGEGDDEILTFTKYVSSNCEEYWAGTGEQPDGLIVLEAVDDAATANWGNGWCMPTSNEFLALCENAEKTFISDNTSVAGLLFCVNTNKLFFPAAGYGGATYLYDMGIEGNYWSSSLNIGGPDYAVSLCISDSKGVYQPGIERFFGFSIRPVKIVAPASIPNPTETDEEEDIL